MSSAGFDVTIGAGPSLNLADSFDQIAALRPISLIHQLRPLRRLGIQILIGGQGSECVVFCASTSLRAQLAERPDIREVFRYALDSEPPLQLIVGLVEREIREVMERLGRIMIEGDTSPPII
jgi:hypothetical protein